MSFLIPTISELLQGHILSCATSSPTVEPSRQSTNPRRSASSSRSRGASMETGKAEEIAMSLEPEEIRQATTAVGQRRGPSDLNTSNRTNSVSDRAMLCVRLYVSGLQDGISVDELFGLAYALKVTEAMEPGFIEKYFAIKEDERKLAKEVEEVLKSSSDSSDSDNEDNAVAGSSNNLEDGPSSDSD
jgi:hypothetical protein